MPQGGSGDFEASAHKRKTRESIRGGGKQIETPGDMIFKAEGRAAAAAAAAEQLARRAQPSSAETGWDRLASGLAMCANVPDKPPYALSD